MKSSLRNRRCFAATIYQKTVSDAADFSIRDSIFAAVSRWLRDMISQGGLKKGARGPMHVPDKGRARPLSALINQPSDKQTGCRVCFWSGNFKAGSHETGFCVINCLLKCYTGSLSYLELISLCSLRAFTTRQRFFSGLSSIILDL